MKDGKQVMTTRRDTTGAAAKLVLRPIANRYKPTRRRAMFAVECKTQTAHVPIPTTW